MDGQISINVAYRNLFVGNGVHCLVAQPFGKKSMDNEEPARSLPLSEMEITLLSGITSATKSEREDAVQRFKTWIRNQYMDCEDGDTLPIEDRVFRILQIYFIGESEYTVTGFIELVDIVLQFPDIFSDRFPIVWSLLYSVIQGTITECMIEPIVRVCVVVD